MSVFVHQHLGMGDHLTCFGLIQTLLSEGVFPAINLFAKAGNAGNVRFLYQDEPRVQVIPLPVARDGATNEIQAICAALGGADARRYNTEVVRIGHDHYKRVECEAGGYIQNDQVFYRQFGVPYEYRFDRCFTRDVDQEEEILRRLNPSGEPYVFVDSAPTGDRGRWLPGSLTAATRLPIVHNDPSIPLLLLGRVLEQAEEIHVAESAIRCLVESAVFDMRRPKLYLNGNLRGNNTRLPWQFDSGDRALTYPMYRGPNGSATPDGHQAGPFAVRRIRPDDRLLLAELFPALTSPYFRPHPLTASVAADITEKKGKDVYAIATIGAQPVGYGFLRGWDDGYEIPRLGIAVHERHRGCGVGHRVMRFLHGEAGQGRVQLRVDPANARAKKLYESLGYVPISQEGGLTVMQVDL